MRLGLLRLDTLLRRLHVLKLLGHLRQADFDLVHCVVQRLDLARELVDFVSALGLLLLQRGLERVQRIGDFIDRIGVLLNQVPHNAHALVEAALHGSHLLLQLLDLGLQLDHLLVDTPGGSGG